MPNDSRDESKKKSKSHSNSRGRRDRFLKMVSEYECAHKSSRSRKTTKTEKPKISVDQVNLAAQRILQNESSRRSFSSSQSATVYDPVMRDQLRQVKKYFRKPTSEKSRAYMDKVLFHLWKGYTDKVMEQGLEKNEVIHSDESGDDSTTVQRKESLVQVGSDDSNSEEKPKPCTDDEPFKLKESQASPHEWENYQAFCDKLQKVLQNVSGFATADVGISFEEFRSLLKRFGATSEQWSNDVTQFRLQYQPQIVVFRQCDHLLENNQAKSLNPKAADHIATLPEQVKSISVLDEQVFFYPNKLIFQ